MKRVAIVQARTGSTRLPRKVLADIEGKSMLVRVVERLRAATRLDEVVVATTTNPGDDAVAEHCESRGIAYFRGDEDDVLDRFWQCATEHEADVIVRVCADCPLIDPELVDATLAALAEDDELDYVALSIPFRTYPLGLDVEAIRAPALERAWREDTRPDWREHVTPYIYRTPGIFKLRGLKNADDLSWMRWTVDTPADLEFVRRIYASFGTGDMTWREVVERLRSHPEWQRINDGVSQRTVS